MGMPMDIPLFSLPSEVRLHVYSFCIREDLKSLSLCSKKLHDDVLPSLWRKVKISWTTLQRITPMLSKGPLGNMQLISHLDFIDSGDELEKGYLGFGFAMLLRDCDPDRMRSLTINDYIVKNGLQFVSEIFPNLHHLELNDVADDWNFLLSFTKLESLVLYDCNITLDHWKEVCGMENLSRLEFSSSFSLMKDDFAKVSFQLTNLLRLDLLYTNVSNELLSLVSTNCRKLRFLDLTSTQQVTDLGLACISHIRTLKHLNLSCCDEITDDGMYFVSQLPSLEYLNLGLAGNVSHRCLGHICKLKMLNYLNINYLPGDKDELFSHVRELTSLRTLEMYGANKLTNSSLEVISHLVHLEKLDISECDNFTDEGLVYLTKLPRLRALKFDSGDDTKTTEEGLELHGLTKLMVDEF